MSTDRLGQLYDAGPFPALEVPRFPPELVAQVERLTGKRFDPRLFETYERVRAFLDYAGPQITTELRSEQVLPDPVVVPQPVMQPADRRRTITSPSRAFDPEDLGD